MIYNEIAKLIQSKFKFINQPTEAEIINILRKITEDTTENELDEIILNTVKDTTSIILHSIDMSSTISILDQIKMALKK